MSTVIRQSPDAQFSRIVMHGESKQLRTDPQLKATYLGG